MGICGSKSDSDEHQQIHLVGNRYAPTFSTIHDNFKTLEEVQEALRSAGLESSNLILGIDYTKSNTWNGRRTFEGLNLHTIRPGILNPYQEVISIVGRTLEVFDDDKLIPTYIFGDSRTADKTVAPFHPDRACYTFKEVLDCYTEITPLLILSGPTSFGPLIREAINIVKNAKAYHILVIIGDGEVTSPKDTRDAIIEASRYPLSIIMIGVGDGPWNLMEEFDDNLPSRKFDNFQFVQFSKVMSQASANREVSFALAALMEIPEQYKLIRKLGYLDL